MKQQQSSQQILSSNNNPIPPPLTLPTQDDHPSSHETINSNQSEPKYTFNKSTYLYTTYNWNNVYLFRFSIFIISFLFFFLHIYRTPDTTKSNSGLNPEADEFVPVFTVIFSFSF